MEKNMNENEVEAEAVEAAEAAEAAEAVEALIK